MAIIINSINVDGLALTGEWDGNQPPVFQHADIQGDSSAITIELKITDLSGHVLRARYEGGQTKVEYGNADVEG